MLKIRERSRFKRTWKISDFIKQEGFIKKNLEYDDIYAQIIGIDMCIYVVISDRIIRFSSHTKKETVKLDTLYDLIKANLVEKVEG